MSKEEIRETLNAQPFRPFVVVMADGNRYLVRRRDYMGISPGQTIVIFNEDGGFRTLDVNEVTGIEPAPREVLEWKQGPLLPVEVARDLWLALHKTRSTSASEPGLEKNEEALYQSLTERFRCEAVILGVECTSMPPEREKS